jgi:hypothetical protein
MNKIILFTALFLLASAVNQLHSQSINNKSWKTYIGAPVNDTAILTIQQDSSTITNTVGQVIVRHQCSITGDTVTIEDIAAEEQGCPGIKGKYKINLTGGSFILTMISDSCDGRSQALAGRRWVEVKK